MTEQRRYRKTTASDRERIEAARSAVFENMVRNLGDTFAQATRHLESGLFSLQRDLARIVDRLVVLEGAALQSRPRTEPDHRVGIMPEGELQNGYAQQLRAVGRFLDGQALTDEDRRTLQVLRVDLDRAASELRQRKDGAL